VVGRELAKVDGRRAHIDAIIRQAQQEASLKGKQIRIVDPLVLCAKRLFPYLPDQVLSEYARTALRVISNGRHDMTVEPQPTLLIHFLSQ